MKESCDWSFEIESCKNLGSIENHEEKLDILHKDSDSLEREILKYISCYSVLPQAEDLYDFSYRFYSAIHGRDRMKELKPLIPHVTDFVIDRLSYEKYIKEHWTGRWDYTLEGLCKSSPGKKFFRFLKVQKVYLMMAAIKMGLKNLMLWIVCPALILLLIAALIF